MELTVQDIKDFLKKQKICSNFDGRIFDKNTFRYKDATFMDFGRGKSCLVNLKEKHPTEVHINRIDFFVRPNNKSLIDLSVEWLEFLMERYKQEYAEYLVRKLKREHKIDEFFKVCEEKKVEITQKTDLEIVKFIENSKAKEKAHRASIDKLQGLVKKQLQEEKTF